MRPLELKMVDPDVDVMAPGDACIWGNAAHAVLLIRLRDMGNEPRYRTVYFTAEDGVVRGSDIDARPKGACPLPLGDTEVAGR